MCIWRAVVVCFGFGYRFWSYLGHMLACSAASTCITVRQMRGHVTCISELRTLSRSCQILDIRETLRLMSTAIQMEFQAPESRCIARKVSRNLYAQHRQMRGHRGTDSRPFCTAAGPTTRRGRRSCSYSDAEASCNHSPDVSANICEYVCCYSLQLLLHVRKH